MNSQRPLTPILIIAGLVLSGLSMAWLLRDQGPAPASEVADSSVDAVSPQSPAPVSAADGPPLPADARPALRAFLDPQAAQ
ncbi:MAG: hypothetical protein EA402_02130, partial [Planctomycetota bacterium]